MCVWGEGGVQEFFGLLPAFHVVVGDPEEGHTCCNVLVQLSSQKMVHELYRILFRATHHVNADNLKNSITPEKSFEIVYVFLGNFTLPNIYTHARTCSLCVDACARAHICFNVCMFTNF